MSGEPTPAWRDRAGFLWLPAGEPGEDKVFCYDAGARRRMGEKWRVQSLEEAAREFGPLVPLEGGGEQEDRVVFLHGRGQSAQVPASYAEARGWAVTGDGFEAAPGCQVALLASGWFWVSEHECAEGVFVVVRYRGPDR